MSDPDKNQYGKLKLLSKEERRLARKERQQKIKEGESVIVEQDYSTQYYGVISINTQNETEKTFLDILNMNDLTIDMKVWVRGRLHTSRSKGKLCFFTIRQRFHTIQAIVSVNERISKRMVNFVANISKESIIDVEGWIRKSPIRIKYCSQQELELHVEQIFIVSAAEPRLPVCLDDLMRSAEDEMSLFYITQEVRLDNRVIDLRTPLNQAIFRIKSGICKIFRDILDSQDFLEIHIPKIITSPFENNYNSFEIDYFNKKAFLAQSPQLYKQFAIAADFNRIYTIGSAFVLQHGHTNRHLTEFIRLDVETTINYHYHEALDIVINLFIKIFENLEKSFAFEIETVHKQYNSISFKYKNPVLRLEYKEAVNLLNQNGSHVDEDYGLSVVDERQLAKLVKERYETDFYVIDKIPLVARPIYIMPDPDNRKLSNSFIVYIRGQEIASGGQRIHDKQLFIERARCLGTDLEAIKAYIEAFNYGLPPHAGVSIGLERMIMAYFDLGNIRQASMFPRIIP